MIRRPLPSTPLVPACLLVAFLTTALLLVGCSDDDRSEPGTTSTPASTSGSSGSSGATTTTVDPAGTVKLTDLGLGVDDPIDLTVRPDSTSLIVASRGGVVHEAVADGGGYRVRDDPVIDLTEKVGNTDMEKGLLGIAVSPDGEHLYVSYTEATHGDSRIDEYPLSGKDGSLRADPSERREILAITQPFPNHNGGALRFGPDGMLYAGFGDGGAADDPKGNGQARDTLLGKVLRIDPSAEDGIPADNPFVDAADAEPLIWMTGLRNPWRIDFDPDTGDMWIGDVGQNEFEEIDWLPAVPDTGKGANLGWDLYEGTNRFSSPDPAPGDASAGPFVDPVHTYSHDHGCSVTGGVVVRDPGLPTLDGWYVFSDFCTPGVRALHLTPPTSEDARPTVTTSDLGLDIGSVVSFARGPAGEVYVISLDDGVQRITPT